MIDKALRDVASADKQTCLDIVPGGTLGDVGARNESDAPIYHNGFGVQCSS